MDAASLYTQCVLDHQRSPRNVGRLEEHTHAADGANPLTLSPSDPNRDSQEGQPYLDDANPYGRQLENRQDRPMGGIGTRVDPKAAERPTDRTEPPSKR